MIGSTVQKKVGPPVALTATGGKFQLVPAHQEIMCLLDDGRLLVSKSHTLNPNVKAFIARLERLKHPYELMPVDMSLVAAAYSQARTEASAKDGSSSNMQEVARELFRKATKCHASDIHIRISKRLKTRIFFRIHSDIEFQEEHSYEFGSQLCTTIYQAMADVADATYETMEKQDARISDRKKIPEDLDGIRIATSPQVDGQVMVLRLLYNDADESDDPTKLGYTGEQSDRLREMKMKPTGMNIIGGPTGSGKSTTLQRLLLSIIKETKGRKNIITVEDPPEYPIAGAVQTPVTNADTEEERSKAFQEAIKSSMRLDPDSIMIGEIRDTPSARLSVQAAMTGHQVWTTVHANSAFSILDRLVDLGVPLELASDPSLVTGLICQRLLKVLCEHCKMPLSEAMDRYEEKDLNRIIGMFDIHSVYVHGDGCEHCRMSGVKGRTAVAETVVTDEQLMTYIRHHDRIGAIRYWRNELHGITMLEHAIIKIRAGIVDPFQAEQVVGQLNARPIE